MEQQEQKQQQQEQKQQQKIEKLARQALRDYLELYYFRKDLIWDWSAYERSWFDPYAHEAGVSTEEFEEVVQYLALKKYPAYSNKLEKVARAALRCFLNEFQETDKLKALFNQEDWVEEWLSDYAIDEGSVAPEDLPDEVFYVAKKQKEKIWRRHNRLQNKRRRERKKFQHLPVLYLWGKPD